MKYSEDIRKVSPLASKIYNECKESGMTIGEFHLLTELLRNIYRKLAKANDERKLSEYCNELIADALEQNTPVYNFFKK